MRQLSLTKYALRSLVQAYLHCRHSAGLLQRYILAGTADTVIKRLQSVKKTAARLVSGTIFRDHYHYSTQPHWRLVWRRTFPKKSTILSLPIWTLHITGKKFLRSSLVADINWIINAKSTDIRQRSFAFYRPILFHWTGSWTVAENLSFWTVLNITLGVSAIQEPYKNVTTYKCCPAGYKKLLVLFFSAAC